MLENTDLDEQSFGAACLAVAGDAADLRDLLRSSGQLTSRALDELDVVLAQATQLRVAVIGDFKRGKSSVINAVLGEELLPTDVLPCTSGIIELTHGPQTEYELVRDGKPSTRSRQDFLLGAGSASLTDGGHHISDTWRVSTPLMPRDFVLVDTPGLNEDQQRIARTEAEASRCHASLLVLAADQPLSRSEQEILGLLPAQSTAFLLNRSDLVRREDLARIAEHVVQRLPEHRAAEPRLWLFSAHGYRSNGRAECTTPDELRRDLVTFVSERSLSSRSQRVLDTVSSTATELCLRAADRVEVLKGDTSGLRTAHEQALEELDRARATSERIVRLLGESADRIALETSDALLDDWDKILDRWAETSSRWSHREPLRDVRKMKQNAEDLADEALGELQRLIDRWMSDRLDNVIVADWSDALDAVSADVTEFLRSVNQVAPVGPPRRQRRLPILRPDGVVREAVTRTAVGVVLALGVGAALRVLVLRQLAIVLATRLALVANPVAIAAGIALIAVDVSRFGDRLRRQVRNAIRRQLTKPETLRIIRSDVRKAVRQSLGLEIRDVQSNLDVWIGDAQSFVVDKWRNVDDAEAELVRRLHHRDGVTAVCDRMVARVQFVGMQPD